MGTSKQNCITQKGVSTFTEQPQLIYQKKKSDTYVAEDQCDCACVAATSTDHRPAIPLTKSSYILKNPHWAIPITPGYHAFLLAQYPHLVVLNNSALTLASHFSRARPLGDVPETWRGRYAQSILKQMVTLGLLVPEGQLMPSLKEKMVLLSAWLHITDRCNLRCAYCYLPHRQVDMKPETGQAVIEAIVCAAVRHGYRMVKLKYAGGEPLLRFPFVVDLHRYAQKLANRHNLTLKGVILSNGTLLTPSIIRTIQSLGLQLMISLDGLRDAHDRQRYFADGCGTSSDVISTIDLALKFGLVPEISVTVSGHNVSRLPLLIEWLLERELPFSLNFYRENDFSPFHNDLKLEKEKIIKGMLAAFKVIEANLPRRSLLASLVDRANLGLAHLRTCSVGHSYLVFDPLGRIAKCQMQISSPLGIIDVQDPLSLVRADRHGLQNKSVEEKEGCRDCRWKYWCTGGCPLATYRVTGRYDVQSPNCDIYKTLYPEVVRLEGLRLLHPK